MTTAPLLTLVHDPGVETLVATGRVLDRHAVKGVALAVLRVLEGRLG